ncbi:MAG: polysaccharide deacetylase family protein [Bacteroidota bacterium]
MKKIFFFILRWSGINALFRTLVQRNKVTILLLHDPTPEAADKTFAYLSKHYNVIDLNTFIEAHQNQDQSNIPAKAVVITFDDGHIGNYHLLPTLKKHQLPITIFLCSSIVGTNRHFWFQKTHPAYDVETLKKQTTQERLRLLGEVGFAKDKEYDIPKAMSKEQIAEMVPYVNFQAHTLFHPCLPMCTKAEAWHELDQCKKDLKNNFQLPTNTISYPNGDYSDRDISLSKKAGYQCGITVDFGFNTLKTDLFRLKRMDVNDTTDVNELAVKASGLWHFFKTRNGQRMPGYMTAVE